MRNFFTSLVTILFFVIQMSDTSGQWNLYCQFSIPGGQFPGSFTDAEFNSIDTGIYMYSQYTSPSSGNSSIVKQTSDGASNWIITTGGGSGMGFSPLALYKLPQFNSFYVLSNSQGTTQLKKSYDGGITWSQGSQIGYWFSGFYACDTSKYYAIHSITNNLSYLTKYENGTINMFYSTFSNVRPILPFFPDTSNGFLIASYPGVNKYNLILKTVDGGQTWNTVFSDSTINIRNIYFINPLVGFVCGDSGLIINTTDGGITWQNFTTNVTANLNSVFFNDSLFGFAAGDSGTIIRTVDGGVNWVQDSSGTILPFLKIYFVNDSIVFAMVPGKMYSNNLNLSISNWQPIRNENATVNIFPNPSTDQISVLISNEFLNLKSELRIYDVLGNVIMNSIIQVDKQSIDLDVSGYPKGIYNLVVINDRRSVMKSFIVN